MCGPRGLKGETDHLFHNNGDGTFTDVSKKAGVTDDSAYYGLASLFIDVNDDGKLDLLVADDSTPNYLYLNKGDGSFEDASFASGYALNESGRETASMGIAVGITRTTDSSTSTTRPSRTTTSRSIATKATPTLLTSLTRLGSPNRQSLFSVGGLLFSTMTTMAGLT